MKLLLSGASYPERRPGKAEEAKTAYQALLNGFGGARGIFEVVAHVGDRYGETGDSGEAFELYRHVVWRRPERKDAVFWEGIVWVYCGASLLKVIEQCGD